MQYLELVILLAVPLMFYLFSENLALSEILKDKPKLVLSYSRLHGVLFLGIQT